MQLSEVFDHLISGELSNTNLGLNLEEGVSTFNYKQIVNFINLGLLDLYSEFPLRTQQAYVQMMEDVHLYHLRKEYCITNTASTEPNKYIIDTVDNPLYERVLRIDEVFNELGEVIPIEDSEDPTSVFIPEVDTLQVRCPNENNALYVMYRAAPNKLDSDVHHINCEQTFNLPYALLEALLTFVTAKVYAKHSTQELINKAITLENKYQILKRDYKRKGLVGDSANSSDIRAKGWV